MAQAKRVVARLTPEENSDVHFLAVTLDPERDDVEALQTFAKYQKVAAPQFNMLTGSNAEINDVLDRMGIERRYNPETHQIDHTNIYLLVDRTGKVAYRFSLGKLQEDWLVEAVKLLCSEPEPKS